MKNVLRAVGGFFAKIGRWIANTAWIQPLLIVGGIFGIIFSIPYIKKAFETEPEEHDYAYEYYATKQLNLADNGVADQLLSYLESGTEESIEKIKNTYGKKFFLFFFMFYFFLFYCH